jgi:crotonobetainyl-CoA:carnitine CoA-transferase CaiB-like acyl-CoA transferase
MQRYCEILTKISLKPLFLIKYSNFLQKIIRMVNNSDLLSGLKVVELASVLAGPAAGLFLAELGAEVVKIENKASGGDLTRQWKLSSEDPDWAFSAYYCSVNWGKTILLLDLMAEQDRKEVLQYCVDADVVIANFKPESAKRMGVDAVSLRALNPKLIYAQISGFGENDDRPAFDVALQAEAGFLYMNGEADRAPAKMPVALIDLLAGHQLKEGILLALLQRQQTGHGATVKVSLLDAALCSLANQATNWLVAGKVPQRLGALHPNIAPYGEVGTCADGLQLVLAVGNDKQFQGLCKTLDLGHLQQDPRFATNAERVKNRPALWQFLEERIAKFEREFLLNRLHEQNVPAGAVRMMPEVMELPAAQALLRDWDLPDGTAVRSLSSIAFSLEPA